MKTENHVMEWSTKISYQLFGVAGFEESVEFGLLESGRRVAEFRVSDEWLDAALSNGYDFTLFDSDVDGHSILDTCAELFAAYVERRYEVRQNMFGILTMRLQIPEMQVRGKRSRRDPLYHLGGPVARSLERRE